MPRGAEPATSPDAPSARAAFQLLCSMVGPTPDLVKIRQHLRDGVDFASLLAVAADHSVRPLLIRTLAAVSWDGVPPSARSDLQAFQRVHGGFCLAAAHQLAR